MSKIYSTDLTDNQWQYIEKILLFEERKRKHDLKEIFNGIFYLVKTGCQWRMLPKEYRESWGDPRILKSKTEEVKRQISTPRVKRNEGRKM